LVRLVLVAADREAYDRAFLQHVEPAQARIAGPESFFAESAHLLGRRQLAVLVLFVEGTLPEGARSLSAGDLQRNRAGEGGQRVEAALHREIGALAGAVLRLGGRLALHPGDLGGGEQRASAREDHRD